MNTQMWFVQSTGNIDYREIVDTEWAQSSPVEIPYSRGDSVCHPELSGVVNLHLTVKESPALSDDRSKIIFRREDMR